MGNKLYLSRRYIAIALASAGILVAYQNCSSGGFGTFKNESRVTEVASLSYVAGFPSMEMSNNPSPALPSQEPIFYNYEESGVGAATGNTGVSYTKMLPTFNLHSVAVDTANNSLKVVVRERSAQISFASVGTFNQAVNPMVVQYYSLSQVFNKSPHALDTTLISRSGEYYTYQLPITELMRNVGQITVRIEGVCRHKDSSGNIVEGSPHLDTFCYSNVSALDINKANSVTFSGPTKIYNGEPLSQPFVATNIQGTMAGCNLDDRSGRFGSSMDGTVQNCRWLEVPNGWVSTGSGRWEMPAPLSSGLTGVSTARFIVADIVQGQVRSVSPTLNVTFLNRP